MKRARELELVVTEIVNEGKAKDEMGNLIHPVMYQPAVMAFFGAPDALYGVLRDSPILVLNLLQANKELEEFWNRFENVWIAWVDMLIEKEMGTYAADIYPFLIVQEYKKRLALNQPNPLNMNILARFFRIDYRGYGDEAKGFNILYYDEMTRLYAEIAWKSPSLATLLGQRFYQYLKIDSNKAYRGVIFLLDCVVVETVEENVLLYSNGYDLDWMKTQVKKIEAWLDDNTLPDAKAAIVIRDLIARLLVLVEARKGMKVETPVLLKLDKSTATPYRTLLYDRDQGLFKTPREQRTFFVSVLNSMVWAHLDRANVPELIEKYGQPFNCALCHCETHSVDTLLMRAFCGETCRSQYVQPSLK